MDNVGRLRVHHLCSSTREAYHRTLARGGSDDSDDSFEVEGANRRDERNVDSSYCSDSSEFVPGVFRKPECVCVPLYREKRRCWLSLIFIWFVWMVSIGRIDHRQPEFEIHYKRCTCFVAPALNITWQQVQRDAFRGFYPRE